MIREKSNNTEQKNLIIESFSLEVFNVENYIVFLAKHYFTKAFLPVTFTLSTEH